MDAQRNENGLYPQRWMSSLPGKNTDWVQGKSRSVHTPAIACTPYDSQYPCLVTWSGWDSPHTISWQRFAPGIAGNEDLFHRRRVYMFGRTHTTTILKRCRARR